MSFDLTSALIGLAAGAVIGFAACFLLLMNAPDDKISPRRWG